MDSSSIPAVRSHCCGPQKVDLISLSKGGDWTEVTDRNVNSYSWDRCALPLPGPSSFGYNKRTRHWRGQYAMHIPFRFTTRTEQIETARLFEYYLIGLVLYCSINLIGILLR